MRNPRSSPVNNYFSELGEILGKLLDSSHPVFTPSLGIVLSTITTSIVSFSRTIYPPILAVIAASLLSSVTKKVGEWAIITLISLLFATIVALPAYLSGNASDAVLFTLRVVASASFFTAAVGGLGWLGLIHGLEDMGLGALSTHVGLLVRYIPEFTRKSYAAILARESRTFTSSRKARWRVGVSVVGDLLYEGFRLSYWLALALKARRFARSPAGKRRVRGWAPTSMDLLLILSTTLIVFLLLLR
jgi:hypothetical protein